MKCSDLLLDNNDDEQVEDEYEFGFSVMTDEEFMLWCLLTEYEEEPYGDC